MGREERTIAFENVRVIRVTDMALLCNIDGEEVWVPQSQIDVDSEAYALDTEGTLIVTRWWVTQKGLV